MGVTDDVLQANQRYAADFRWGHLPIPPARKLAVVACMDARLDVEATLGLNIGDAHIIRNAGGVVTEDALRTLIISHHLLDTQEFMIINHTDCGMLTFTDESLRNRLTRETGTAVASPPAFHSFTDLDEHVRQQIQKIRAHPWIPRSIPVRGFVYDVRDGRLREVAV